MACACTSPPVYLQVNLTPGPGLRLFRAEGCFGQERAASGSERKNEQIPLFCLQEAEAAHQTRAAHGYIANEYLIYSRRVRAAGYIHLPL
jgi:hypothetical protein